MLYRERKMKTYLKFLGNKKMYHLHFTSSETLCIFIIMRIIANVARTFKKIIQNFKLLLYLVQADKFLVSIK